MISEKFLDLILELYFCNKPSTDVNIQIVKNDLIMILGNIEKKNEVPELLIPKFNLIKYMVVEFDVENKSADVFADEISNNVEFSQFTSHISFLLNQDINITRVQEILAQITYKKESIIIEDEKKTMEAFLDKYENNLFKSTSDMISNFETMISEIYTRTLLKKRYTDMTNDVSEFDFYGEENVENAFDIMEKRTKATSKIVTQNTIFDKKILRGGFENGRIYIFAGQPGSGKSLFLARYLSGALNSASNQEGLYMYYTLENFIDETLERVSKIMSGMIDDRYDLNDKENLKSLVKTFTSNMSKHGKVFNLKFLPSPQSTVNDIMIHIEETMAKTKKKPRMIVVDYLDLLSSINKTDIYRLELGYITMELKLLAIKYDCPVVTVTQFNSGGYRKGIPSLDSITESKKKIEHADFVAFLIRLQNKIDPNNEYLNRVIISTKKNRNGPLKDISYKVDYQKFIMKEESSSPSYSQILNNYQNNHQYPGYTNTPQNYPPSQGLNSSNLRVNPMNNIFD